MTGLRKAWMPWPMGRGGREENPTLERSKSESHWIYCTGIITLPSRRATNLSTQESVYDPSALRLDGDPALLRRHVEPARHADARLGLLDRRLLHLPRCRGAWARVTIDRFRRLALSTSRNDLVLHAPASPAPLTRCAPSARRTRRTLSPPRA